MHVKTETYFKKKGGEANTFRPVAHASERAEKGMACSVLAII